MQDTIQSRNQFIKAISQRGVIIAGIILLGVGGAMIYRWMQMASVEQEADAPVITPVIQTVTALGRLEPRGTAIALSAPTSSQGNRVERLLVQEGDRIQAGQVIAILDSHDQRKAALEEAEEQVNVARAQLDVIQAGAKQGEINAQQAEIARLSAERQGNIEAQVATVARLQSELQNAQAEFNRYQLLYQEGAISASERDSRRLALDTAQKSVQEAQVNLARLRSTTPAELNRARATLEQIAEVRPVDVRSAQAEVNRAIAARNQAKASFEQSVVRSPIDGEVLDIYTRAGEVVSTDGIAEIGQTQQMRAIAEVYQSDISKVQVGQRVRVTSDSIASELAGTVERIGSQVRRQAIVNTDPSANIDARVIEVQINLDDASSQEAAKFTNLQVQVVIEQ
ncbi:ABC exporter membrane fusion protein [Gloeocapsopsis crepidinum LEGE 06123]|uniref:ABC exporter membrane fusion protein n=1 Tax=Gloeocapsopsis crepidinum LEGE 06123 TaxID=588587 RepID=A0ABR9UT91_9CHRO|nr:ABC exporter membrane fusion protein [Gloeocapsopsis crepidinum]MBE9191263.1 ABC exporter membrane fusion protein [Gloeocapsopsis crepidinum LEGE 06123]